MRTWLASLASVSLALVGCSSAESGGGAGTPGPATTPPGPETSSATTTLPRVACRFNVPTSLEGSAYECFDVVVPENRSVPGSRMIQVHAIRFHGKPGGTTTVELNGGPGGPSEDAAMGLALGVPELKDSLGKFLEIGDYVMFDQRGVGRSVPRIDCTEAELSLGPVDGSKKCADRWTAKGVDLTGYVTSENAEDVHDLVVGLGLSRVNLHSISYGTRLALEVLRRHPGEVAHAIIDGVMPAQAKALTEGDQNFDAVFTRVFQSCAADAACKAAYPDLEKALSDVKTKLGAHPFSIEGQPFGWDEWSGELMQNLYADGFAGEVPFLIYDMLDKTPQAFAADMDARMAEDQKAMDDHDALLASTPIGREVAARVAADKDPGANDMPMGMYFSVVCSDYVQYESLDEALALEAKVRPALQNELRVHDTWDGCTPWPKRAKTSDVWAAVTSDRPVLAVGGAYDPATPVVWRDLAAATLSASQKVTMAAGAHGAMDPCAMGLKMAFLGDGSVDAACASQQSITFHLPSAPPKKLHPRRLSAGRRVGAGAMPVSPVALALLRGRR